ncbi:minor tail protein [Arthrobacter phage CastorTray]|uniref:Minor tail protein n=1 Tax=Arthrobacter phage CastorTray TaxID=2859632 RepID=A0AAE7WDW5_9CAUD|nr:minor tail protein [Arthrobacter phage CastorTray]QYC55020.1 minor tail protein [Arthrobacter phage CastorTray]
MPLTTFSGNGNYQIDVDGAFVGQHGMISTVYWRVIVHKSNTTGHRAWGNTGSSGIADGNPGRLWTNNNLEFNFQNGSMSGSFLMAEGYFDVQHRADGHAEYAVSGGLTLAGLGSASASTGWRSLPHIQTASVPEAPTSLGVDQAEMTSLRYRFQGNGDGGAYIQEWQVAWEQDGYSTLYTGSNGTLVLTGLNPGALYHFSSRARNSQGWGPWSARSSGRTLAGARVKHNGVWREAIPYVKHNGAWKLAQPYSKINGIWRKSI